MYRTISVYFTEWDKCSDEASCVLNVSATSTNPGERISIHKDVQIIPPSSETAVQKIANKAVLLYCVESYFLTYMLNAGLIPA